MDELLRDDRDGVTWLTLNRPERVNAVNPPLRDALIAALDAAPADGVRAIVLSGTGRGFCSGVDLADTSTAARGVDVLTLMKFSTQRLTRALIDCPVPVVTAVHGACAGLGMTLAFGADVCVADEEATFSASFVRRGLVPDSATTHILPRSMGLARARRFLLTGATLTAAEAAEAGLVSDVVPSGTALDAATKIAEELARFPTQAIGLTKALLAATFERSLDEHLREERTNQALMSTTDDMAEGITAFREKRPPRFTGH
jgi:2-(1,2-epoxy-1,2-dihydrophenyl)acetyl-CoA isomerase